MNPLTDGARQYRGQLNSMNVELLNRKIAALEIQILDQEDTIEALNRWIGNKQAQCLKCKIGQKKVKDQLKAALAGVASAEEECGCGGNCQCEGEDCC